ncbi:MAG: hypothetical protein HY787_24045, partial [Deltaproteobacteria bacterium]|nr:hypothetical protein [Deltaproteobacteria bacterium]
MTAPKGRAQTTEEYIGELKEALSRNPDCGTSHYNLAVAFIKQGFWDEAI